MRHAALRLQIVFLLLTAQASAQSTIRFGVLELFHPRELELSPGGTQPLLITGLPQPVLLNREPSKHRLLLRADGDHVVVSDSRAARLEIASRDGLPVRFQLMVPGKLHRVYEGELNVTASHGTLVAIVSMNREMAVATIVASEMSVKAPLEALKAQAVVTRSFLAAGSRHAAFDFCDTTHCQYLRSPDEVTPRVRTAADDTRGLVLTWRSQVIAALYSSRCGGRTRSLQEAGMNSGNGYPYYAVACTWCHSHPEQWETRLPFGAPPSDPASQSSKIAQDRQSGWSALPGDAFHVEQDETDVLIRGRRVGHGFGLCQFGAIGMASAGADFHSILAHYYPNTVLTRLVSRVD